MYNIKRNVITSATRANKQRITMIFFCFHHMCLCELLEDFLKTAAEVSSSWHFPCSTSTFSPLCITFSTFPSIIAIVSFISLTTSLTLTWGPLCRYLLGGSLGPSSAFFEGTANMYLPRSSWPSNDSYTWCNREKLDKERFKQKKSVSAPVYSSWVKNLKVNPPFPPSRHHNFPSN